MNILFKLLRFLLGFVVVTFVIYWFALDSKLIRALQPWLGKFYDEMPRNRGI